MPVVAYLINRYPELSLTGIRREIDAVTAAGWKVLRFAHRPSAQPLAGEIDRAESAATEYLAIQSLSGLLLTLLRVMITRPARFLRALRTLLELATVSPAGLGHLALACRLTVRLEEARAAHLHVHFAQSSAIVARLARILGGPPWSMTVHGPEDFEPENRRRLAALVLAANRTIAISEWAACAARQAASPGEIDLRVIRMGVSGRFLAPPVRIAESSPIACIARFERRKGLSELLDALAMLASNGLRPQIELIGDGPLRQLLEADIRRRGLVGQVRLCGWLSELEVLEKLDRCRFLVVPSLAEGLPVAIVEAFSRARPVIATEVAGVGELVKDHVNGLLVPPGDSFSLDLAIGTFMGMAIEELLEFGLRGRAIVLERFDSHRNGSELAAVFRDTATSGS